MPTYHEDELIIKYCTQIISVLEQYSYIGIPKGIQNEIKSNFNQLCSSDVNRYTTKLIYSLITLQETLLLQVQKKCTSVTVVDVIMFIGGLLDTDTADNYMKRAAEIFEINNSEDASKAKGIKLR